MEYKYCMRVVACRIAAETARCAMKDIKSNRLLSVFFRANGCLHALIRTDLIPLLSTESPEHCRYAPDIWTAQTKNLITGLGTE